MEYVLTVPHDTEALIVTASPRHEAATIAFGDEPALAGEPSDPIPLPTGTTLIDVTVTAEDAATTATSSLSVTRPAPPDERVYLSDLHASAAAIEPTFEPFISAYTVQVSYEADDTMITAALASPTATLTIDGSPATSGVASAPIALDVGANAVEVLASEGDRATLTTITIMRAAPDGNTDLDSITLSDGTLEPRFDPSRTAYDLVLPYDTATLTITATTSADTATITNAPPKAVSATSDVKLEPGSNSITIEVTAQDGSSGITNVNAFRRNPEDMLSEVWVHQVGTSDDDWFRSVAVDPQTGDIAVAGEMPRDEAGYGLRELLVQKLSPGGEVLWEWWHAEPKDEQAYPITIDVHGNILVPYTDNSEPPFGGYDVGIVKLSPSGQQLWVTHVGTEYRDTPAGGIVTDAAASIYLAWHNGFRNNTVLTKFDPNGNLIWEREIGAAYQRQYPTGLTFAPDGNLVLLGATDTAFDGPLLGSEDDIFTRKYTPDGDLIWATQIGTPYWDFPEAVTVLPNGQVAITSHFIAPATSEKPEGYDAYAALLEEDGNLLWDAVVSTDEKDLSGSIVASNDAIYMIGRTNGQLGNEQVGSSDIFVHALDLSGDALWTEQFGTPSGEHAYGAVLYDNSTLLIAGTTSGDWGAPLVGGERRDGILVKLLLNESPVGAW